MRREEEQPATIIRPAESAEIEARDLFLKINTMDVEKPASFVGSNGLFKRLQMGAGLVKSCLEGQ